MEPKNNNEDDRDRERLVGSWLDALLKQYGEAEPRPGLEGRVWANLRTELEPGTDGRWSWAAGLGVLLAVMVGGGIFWARGPGALPETTSGQRSAPAVLKAGPAQLATTEARSPADSALLSSVPRTAARRSTAAVADEPRLEQFPSPRPLSEQEEMLARYVQEETQEAKLVAKAQTEMLKKELLEFENLTNLPEPSQDSEPIETN
jgi:hypothetical protein